MHLLAQGLEGVEDIFSHCLLCGACEQVCPRGLPITRLVAEARSGFSRLSGPHGLTKAALTMALGRPALLETLAGLGRSLHLPLVEEGPRVAQKKSLRESFDGAYFLGCFARHLQPSVAQSTRQLLRHCDLAAVTPEGQGCCGLAAFSAGYTEEAQRLARKNIHAFSEQTGWILTSCASCTAALRSYPHLFAPDDPWQALALDFAARVQEWTCFFQGRLKASGAVQGLRVFYHDPCHLRFLPEGRTAPRQLLNARGYTVLEPENGPRCCGQGGLFHIAWPESAAALFARSSQQALAQEPEYITSTCSGCLLHYQSHVQKKAKVVHLAVLLEEGLEKTR
jgi:glycolate oxidase iron-sulfur subunit